MNAQNLRREATPWTADARPGEGFGPESFVPRGESGDGNGASGQICRDFRALLNVNELTR